MSPRRLLLAILPCLAVLSVAGTTASVFAQAPRWQVPSDGTLGRLGLTRAWWGFATVDTIRDRLKYVITDEQVTVTESTLGSVTTFDNATGRRRWAVQVGAETDLRYCPVTSDQHVLILSGRKLFALDKQTGDAAWEVALATAPSASPAADDARAYVGSIDGSVYAYDLKFLSRLSKDTSLGRFMYRSLAWSYRTGGRIPYPCAPAGTIVCVPSSDGSLYGLDSKEHKPKFQFETDQPLTAPIGQAGQMIVVATADRKLYGLNAVTGALKWEMLLGLSVKQQPRIIGEHVFVCPVDNAMRCYLVQNGREVWSNPESKTFLAATPTTVYTLSSLGDVLMLNRTNGRRVGAFSMRGFNLPVSNDRTDRLYLASDTGLVVSVRERDREYPLFHKQPEKRPVEPEIAPEEGAAKPKPTAKKPAAKKAADPDEAMEEKKDPDTDAAPAVPAKPAKAPAVKKPLRRPAKVAPKQPATDTE